MNDQPTPLRCDTADMLVVHNFFRHLFTQARVLIRDVPDADTARAGLVADHLREITAALHQHHATEEEALGDVLVRRVPACALHVDQMHAQHAAVAALAGELKEVLPAFESTASAPSRQAAMVALDAVRTTLVLHLGAEEDDILPVAGSTLSQAEWDRIGEAAQGTLPRDRMFVRLGWLLASMSPRERAAWLRKNLPLPARLAYKAVGQRQFEADHRRLFPPAALAPPARPGPGER